MVRGAFWLFIEKGSQQIASFVVFTLIARFIGPEQYGLVALCSIFLSLAINIINGLVDAVIALQVKDDLRLSSLFWTVLACGTFLSLVSYGSAGLFADVIGQPEVAPLLRSFAIIPVLIALASIPTALVTASMDFRIFTIRTLFANVAGGIVGVVMAIRGFGAYALAAQQIMTFLVINIVVWPGCRWYPRFLFKFHEMSEILTIGMHQIGSSFISFFEQQGGRVLLGYFVGPAAVGQYVFTQRVRFALEDALIQPIVAIIYPAFAQMRDDQAEKDKIFGQLLLAFGTIILPAVVGAIVTAPLYVPLIFGQAWEPSAPYLQLAFVTSVSVSMEFILRDLLRAHKFIGTYFRAQTAIVMAGFAFSALLAPHGLYAYMCGQIAIYCASITVYLAIAARKTHIRVWRNLARLWRPAVGAIIMGITVELLTRYAPSSIGTLSLLAVDVVVGAIVYAIICSALQFRQIKSLIDFIRKMKTAREKPISAAEFSELVERD
jgi:PST family polysaccharide transporter